MSDKFNCGIYKITAPSGNFYIGSSKTIPKRWAEHKNLLKRGAHYNSALQNSWNKYGNKLKFEILLICRVEDLLFYEQICLDNLKPEYNICSIAGNTLGVRPSAEIKKKIGSAQVGRKHSEETKAKMSAAHKGVKKSQSHIAKMVATKTGQKYGPCSEERKRKIGLANRGRKFSPEIIQKLKDAWILRRIHMEAICP